MSAWPCNTKVDFWKELANQIKMKAEKGFWTGFWKGHPKGKLQGHAARTTLMMVPWTSSHLPRADCRVSMPSCCTELEQYCNHALARCTNLASRSCNPRAANAMKSRSSCMSLQFIFRVPFPESFTEFLFSFHFYLVNKLLPIVIFCITCPSFHFKFPFQWFLFQSPFQIV